MLITSINISDAYTRVSPVTCWKLNIIAVYCIFLFVSSILVNGTLLWIFFKVKELRTPINIFVIVFTVLSLIGSSVETPFVITSNFACRFALK